MRTDPIIFRFSQKYQESPAGIGFGNQTNKHKYYEYNKNTYNGKRLYPLFSIKL